MFILTNDSKLYILYILHKIERVNWYDEELDKFYDTDKDNKGLIHGVYSYDGENIIDVQWFKTEKEREKQIKINRGRGLNEG